MTISLDLEMLEELGLRPDEFVYLECLRRGENFSTLEVEATKLERQGYIKIGPSDVVLRSKYIDLFTLDKDTVWREFCNMYPFKVNGPSGERILHTHDPDAKSNEKLKKKYLKIIAGKPGLHKKIMQSLDLYLLSKRGNLGYLPALETFINNQTWESMFHEIGNYQQLTQKKTSYGGTLK